MTISILCNIPISWIISWISRANPGEWIKMLKKWFNPLCNRKKWQFCMPFSNHGCLKKTLPSSYITIPPHSNYSCLISSFWCYIIMHRHKKNRNFFMHNMSKNNKNKNFSISFCIFTDSLLYATLLDCQTLS